MTYKFFWELFLLSAGLLTVGSIACLPLYQWQLRTFFASRLWVKIYWWLPILTGFLFVLAGGWPVASIVVFALAVQAGREWHAHAAGHIYPSVYTALFMLALAQLVSVSLLPDAVRVPGLAAICFASVLSDVLAFFVGSYFGRHTLPDMINVRKSWEGIGGQIVGSFLGLGLVALTPEVGFSVVLALSVGIASAAGDLLNSAAKRQLGIKDWGQAIPGHGGVLDRFSSLSFALAAGYIVLLLRY